MRIGFFVWEYPPRLVGGLGTYAQYVTREYIRLGHNVTVFTLNPGKLKTTEVLEGVNVERPMIVDASNVFPVFVAEDLIRWGTNIRFFNDIFMYNILSSSKFVNEFVNKEGYHFDVVCVHDWLSCISGLIIKNETKIPVVFHVHSTEWGRSGGHGSEVVSHLEEVAAQNADKIVTVSNVMQDDLTKHGWPQSQISVIWNGVDPEEYDMGRINPDDSKRVRQECGVPEDWNMILFLGRLTWVKSIKNLVQAMPLVFEEFPKTKLVILGKGEEQTDIIDMSNRLGIKDKVVYRFDFVPEEERILYYAASDVCVFPSVYEPFGIVSLEAMSMAKPVIVGAKGVVGFREQVISSGPSQNGIHINGEDPADIAWGIKETLRDPKKARKWGQNGRQRVLDYFTWKKVAEQTLDVYGKLIKT